MVFSSIIFLTVFFPFFFILYYVIPKSWKNIYVLLASILFYAWGAPKFIFAILATTTLDFFLVKTIYNSRTQSRRVLFLILSLCLNVGMLFYFKYCNFFIENFNLFLSTIGIKNIAWTKVVLPIGISFYTFESLTYVVDVYRRVHKPLNNFMQYQLYIILFPKLIAGPIIRYHEISEQIEGRLSRESVDDVLGGFYRFVIGLSKKVFIANSVALVADNTFNYGVENLSTQAAWIGMLAYTMQIYFDFSGYSDMAIGMGRMMGFRFPENFDNPYTAGSITEFWRRWHITLGSWMRNYLYIPLGGNQVKSKFRLYFNLWFVFLISGFWHGAAWTFIFWGVYHGVFLVLERLFLLRLYSKIPKLFSVFITFIIVNIGWVFFRMESISQAFGYVKKLFVVNRSYTYLYYDNEFWTMLTLGFLFSFFTLSNYGKRIQQAIYFDVYTNKKTFAMAMLCLLLYFLCLANITSSSFNPFIYFRF